MKSYTETSSTEVTWLHKFAHCYEEQLVPAWTNEWNKQKTTSLFSSPGIRILLVYSSFWCVAWSQRGRLTESGNFISQSILYEYYMHLKCKEWI